MKYFSDSYEKATDTAFFNDIRCIAHIINIIVQVFYLAI
jgi:hypothetical protein